MKIVFLDRDGVINQYPGAGKYVTKVKEFHFIPGVKRAMAALTEAGYKIFVISNQAGVGRGLYSIEKLNRIDAYMKRNIQKAGGKIHSSFYCTHHPDNGCACRKPAVGMVKEAMKTLHRPLSDARSSFFVGDTQKDIQTGSKVGCRTIFVRCGGESKRNQWIVKPNYIVKDLDEAVEIILKDERV